MGVDFVLRMLVKVLFFVVFIVVAQSFILLLFSYINDYMISFDSSIMQIASWLGVFKAFAVFLNILAFGFVGKIMLRYWSSL